MADADLKVRTERRGAVCVVTVRGDLAAASCAGFTQAVNRASADAVPRPGRVVVDLSGVRLIDPFGARALEAVVNPEAGRIPVLLRSLRPTLRETLAAVIPDLDLTRSGLVMARPDAAADVDAHSPTWDLVQESRRARSRALRTIAECRHTAERIAATEDRVAATFLRLAPKRPRAHDEMIALSRLASGYANYLRDHAGIAAASQASPPAATSGPSGDDAGTLQRAMAFIHEHARDDISAADIAGAACVTTRAVQLAFRRYAGTTPMGYLRQVRLDQAHRELLAARPAPGIVTRIAADWQFGNPGRFTAYYRAAFGVLPSQTLQDGSRAGSG